MAGEERRIVTVLFADVTGSTALGEELDPEDVRALLARYYSMASEIVKSQGGVIEKFIGDAVMAVFGLRRSYGDDPERAIAAAIEMREACRADPALADLRLRFGISTGEVVANRDSTATDFLVTGDTVNIAARLEEGAEPWSILATERTARAAGKAYDFGPLHEIQAKGKTAPIPAREVIARLEERRGPLPGRPPLIGRDHELEHLRVSARRAFEQKRPGLVSILAPAGGGKSRLLEEFLERSLPKLAPDARVAFAQCLPYGQRLTYWPLRQILFSLASIDEEAQPDEVRSAILRWIGDQAAADLLATTVGDAATAMPDRHDLFSAWRKAILHAARDLPLVLVFEDLHWSSDSLLDLIEFLMHTRGEVAIVMIALARPELLDRRPNLGGGRHNFVHIALEPLRSEEIAELIGHVLKDWTPQLVAQVVARAEGNPFYAGELAHAMAEQGSPDALPDTVHAAVQARLDLLPEGERRLLQLGAVYGRAFRPSDVAALAGDLNGQVDTFCEALSARDLLRPAEGGRFAFRHILIREVAYQSLPRHERARLHAVAAAWIEERVAGREDALAEILAYHYREATALSHGHRIQPPEYERYRASAFRWLKRAADVAAAAAAELEAARHLRHAIEIAPDEELPELWERLGDVQQLQAPSIDAYQRALEAARAAGRPYEDELRIISGLLIACMRWWTGRGHIRPEEVNRLRAEGAALAEKVEEGRVLARFLAADAFYPFFANQEGVEIGDAEIAGAEAQAKRAVEIADRLELRDTWSAAMDALSGCAMERGDWTAARELARRRLQRQNRLGMIERLDAFAMVSWPAIYLGDLHDADQTSALGIAIVQPGHQLPGAVYLAGYRLYALAALGRLTEVLTLSDHVHQMWVEIGRPMGLIGLGFAVVHDVAVRVRDHRRAERMRDVMLEMANRSANLTYLAPLADRDLTGLERVLTSPLEMGHTRALVAERALAVMLDHDHLPAPETSRALLRWAVDMQLPLVEAQARRAIGLTNEDMHELHQALTIWEHAHSIPYVARVHCERAALLGEGDEMAQGVEVLKQLGEHEFLDRLAVRE